MALSGSEIRRKFVLYFKDKRGHLHLPSSSVIPDNPTLLLTSAGMVQFVPIFLGKEPPPSPPRVVTVQKCARAGGKDSDIENIGRTARHHSFFEMLGNFSFGDYFKKEVIPWAWEWVTKDLGLEPEKLSVTIFKGDDQNPADEEAFEIWNKTVGVPAERIFRMSRKDNFWGPPGPTGPCGPCSEIYYDRGPEYACSDDADVCGIGKCECDRYLEFWNLVFMEMLKDENGKFTPLEKKNVDTGAGLDRIATILQRKNNTFETDLLFPVLEEVCKLSGTKYTGGNPKQLEEGSLEWKKDSYLKIVTDHARCITFLMADGVRPTNVGRGYVLKFIIRRAARFGRLLGITEPFIYKLVDPVVRIYGDHYSELRDYKDTIVTKVQEEEKTFAETIERGSSLLNELLEAGGNEIDGAAAFNLYSTYGFPIELTQEIAQERGKTVNMEGFASARKKHEEASSAGQFNVVITSDGALGKILQEQGETVFTGYDSLQGEANVVALLNKQGNLTEGAEEGEEVQVVLDSTPFYAESGGQVGDTGMLENSESRLAVIDTKKQEGLIVHKVRALSGVIERGQKVKAQVDRDRRIQTMLHHSAAHIFHAAIREILGEGAEQAGSQVGPNTMRFDFTFKGQPTPQQIAKIESLMNEWTRLNLPVTTVEMSLQEAKKSGAIAMFGEKYGERVRVVKMGDFSLEFCGGTHISSTGEIGPIKIISEGSISSGTRRVEALAGPKAWNFIADSLSMLSDASSRLRVKPGELSASIEKLQDQLKEKDRIAKELEEKLALSRAAELLNAAENCGEVKLIRAQLHDISADGLRALGDFLRRKGDNYVILLACALAPDKVSLVGAVSDPLTKKGFNAGNIVKDAASLCGGGGGGRPELAQAGGKDASKIGDALSQAREKLCAQASKG